MVMGSSTMVNSTNDCIDEQYYDEIRSKRPDFFPCSVCGRFFTTRAMLVHKRTCLENETCQCSVCTSESKKIKWDSLKSKSKISLGYSSKRAYQKKKNKIKSRFRDVLTGKLHNVKNGQVGHNNKLLTFKLVDKDSYIIDKMVEDNNSSKWMDSSDKIGDNAVKKEDSTPSETFPAEVSDNAESSFNKSCETSKLKEKLDHDCNRKLFCCFCSKHLFWESFGLHVIQHCETIQNDFLKCPDSGCDRFFSQPALFLTHYLVHNAEHPLDCKECSCTDLACSSTVRIVDEHGYAETDPFHCYICLTRFSHPQTVINHMRLHSKEMPFKCTVCNRSFRQIGNLQRHMTTHRGDRPYKCTECPSSFADPATLRNHERVHTGETPYVCNVCNRGFTQVGNLKRHMALHLQKDPSSTTFSSTIEVSADENTISIIKKPDDIKVNVNVPSDSQQNNNEQGASEYTNIKSLCKMKISNRKNGRKNGKMKVFTCTICNKVYAWQHDLAVHFRTHTGEKPYKCDICGKQFAQSGAVRIHKDRHHSDLTNKLNGAGYATKRKR